MSTPERDLIVGGQAVIEGVMMRTPNAYAIAVRKPDGTIVNTAARLPKWSDKYPILKLPVLRGGAVLVQSMGLGIKALNYSANEAFVELEDAKTENVKVALSPAVIEGEGDFAGLTGAVPGLIPVPTQKRSRDELKKGTTAAAAGSIVFALIFNILLFVAAPLLLTNALFIAAGWAAAPPAAVSSTASAPAADGSATVTEAAPVPWYESAWTNVRWYLHPVRPSVAFNLIDGLFPDHDRHLLAAERHQARLRISRRGTQDSVYMGGRLAANGRERAATATTASPLRHQFSDGRHAGRDYSVLGYQV
jgi:hypothetical protein